MNLHRLKLRYEHCCDQPINKNIQQILLLCNQRIRGDHRSYISDHGKQIKVCLLCTEYAERRAYRKA